MKNLLIATGWTSFGDCHFAKDTKTKRLSLALRPDGYKLWADDGLEVNTYYIEPKRDVDLINRISEDKRISE